MTDKMQSFLACADTFRESYPESCTLIVFDTEQVVAFMPSANVNLQIPVGTPIERFRGSISERALTTGARQQEERGPEQYGIPYIGTATPIRDQGEVVGVYTVMFPTAKLYALRNGAAELTGIIEEVTANTETVTESADEVSVKLNQLHDESQAMKRDIDKISDVLGVIHNIATQSHMLGLNAAIEAARAGEHGRGFGVVAQEIRKMAEDSRTSLKDVQDQLAYIHKLIARINAFIGEISDHTEANAASMQELNAAYAHVTEVATKLLAAAESK